MTSEYYDKIVGKAALVDIITEMRQAHRTIVLCHGCFDIVHPGHIRHLEYARKHGDILLVSITGDAGIDKDVNRPYVPQELRAGNLAALESVDLVYIDPHHTAADLIRTVKPEVYVKGEEYQRSKDPRFLEEQKLVEHHGGRVLFSSGDVVFSSTELLKQVGREVDIEHRRLQHLCQRHAITADVLYEISDRFADRRVLVIGDTVIDRYVLCDAIDVANEAPMMSLNQLDENTYVGGAAIVARHLHQLGAAVTLMSSFGNDGLSNKTVAQLNSEGVETLPLFRRDHLVVKTRFVVEDAKLLKVERSEYQPPDTRAVRRAKKLILDQAASVDGVVFCDFGYGVITEGLLLKILPQLRGQVDIITADISGSRGNLLHFKQVDLFCPTEREIRATLNDYEVGLAGAAWELLRATQARHLIATLGRRGLVAFDRQSQDPTSLDWSARLRSEYLQALNGRAIDVLGCGDALLAGSTLALCCQASFIQAAYLGSAMAAIESNEMGNVPISLDRLRCWLSARPELTAEAAQPV